MINASTIHRTAANLAANDPALVLVDGKLYVAEKVAPQAREGVGRCLVIEVGPEYVPPTVQETAPVDPPADKPAEAITPNVVPVAADPPEEAPENDADLIG